MSNPQAYDDLTFAQLLASRLCHDLAAPLSAISMGIEMLEQTVKDPESLDHIKNLLQFSCDSAITRLEYYRLLLGNNKDSNSPSWQTLQRVIYPYVAYKKSNLEFETPLETFNNGYPIKLFSALVYIALESALKESKILVHCATSVSLVCDKILVPECLLNEATQQIGQISSQTIMYFYSHKLFNYFEKSLIIKNPAPNLLQLTLS